LQKASAIDKKLEMAANVLWSFVPYRSNLGKKPKILARSEAEIAELILEPFPWGLRVSARASRLRAPELLSGLSASVRRAKFWSAYAFWWFQMNPFPALG
jgi:hypothetical protein